MIRALLVLALLGAPAWGSEAMLAELGEASPYVRVGLDEASALELDGRFTILDPSDGGELFTEREGSRLRVVAEGGPVGEVRKIYRVQVGAYADEAAAENELERLRDATGEPGVLHYDPDRGNHRVRLGAAASRRELGPLLDRLRGMGLERLWVAEEAAEDTSQVTLRLIDEAWSTVDSGLRHLLLRPTRGSIELEGTRYRGLIELRVSPAGRVRGINRLGLESYLRGVVPVELGPEVWPELEALKAQAVAARTYLWRNRGQFETEGFDVCATPRCQAYGGRSAEHPMSDRAVRETRGEILTYDGEPIVAYYSATCGGHTEDGELIFPGDAGPYLKGVSTLPPAGELERLRAELTSTSFEVRRDETGNDVTRAAALLSAAGVVEPGEVGAAAAGRRLDAERLLAWSRRLGELSGRRIVVDAEGKKIETLAEASSLLVEALGWEARAELLFGEGDLDAMLRDDQARKLDEPRRRALATLARYGGLTPDASGRYRVDAAPSPLRLLPVLAAVGEEYRAFGLREATFARVDGERLLLKRGKGSSRVRVGASPLLFGRSGGRSVAVARLELWPGDKIRYRIGADGRVDFLELLGPIEGAADDRRSSVFAWQVRKTRRQLEASINRRLSVGRLEEIRIVRRGSSGRIVELEVVGSRGSERVNGFDIRGLFGSGVRDLLMVVELQRAGDGRIEGALLTGKGWGHGVGMCQVGAYGMALRGADYRTILLHHYSDVTLGRIGGSGS